MTDMANYKHRHRQATMSPEPHNKGIISPEMQLYCLILSPWLVGRYCMWYSESRAAWAGSVISIIIPVILLSMT